MSARRTAERVVRKDQFTQGCQELRALMLRQRREDPFLRAVHQRHDRRQQACAGFCQPESTHPAVSRGRVALDQSTSLKPVDDPADRRGVEADGGGERALVYVRRIRDRMKCGVLHRRNGEFVCFFKKNCHRDLLQSADVVTRQGIKRILGVRFVVDSGRAHWIGR